MDNIKNNISKIDLFINTTIMDLTRFKFDESMMQRKDQLRVIEDSIKNLEKYNTPIPEELRDLKLKLIDSLSNWEEVQKLKISLFEILDKYLKELNDSGIDYGREKIKSNVRKKFIPRVSMLELILSNTIPSYAKLTRIYKGIYYEGHIDKKGLIIIEINNKLEKFKSPSASAKFVTQGKALDGWIWWKIEFDGKKEILDSYRKKYLANEN